MSLIERLRANAKTWRESGLKFGVEALLDEAADAIEEAVTAERERCAQVAEDAWLDYAGESGSAYICDFVATAIRKEPND